MKTVKIISRVISTILIVVLATVLLSNLYLMLAPKLFNNPNPTVFGYSTAVVVSGSMAPTINVEDMVIIKKADDYKVGDIISFTNGKSRVTHRIIEITPEGYITQGDANNSQDIAPIPVQAVTGKVIKTIPGVGNIIRFIQSPLCVMILVMIAALIMLIPLLFPKENINENGEKQQ